MAKPVRLGFESQGVMVSLTNIMPMKQLKPALRNSEKYQQILTSVREIGLVEPLVVFPQKGSAGLYSLLDGHIRLDVLKKLGLSEARCLISVDDEAYTYNKRVNRVATIQEHMMILKAIKNGVSEERIAKVLNVNLAKIRATRDLLDGICKETVETLKTRHVSSPAFAILKKMKPMRQIEVAELMVAANNYALPYAKALLAATPAEMLVDADKHKAVEGITPEQVAKMQKEMAGLQKELKGVEETHGSEVLNLVMARGYLSKLFSNPSVSRFLGQYHADLFGELQNIVAGATSENGI
jgi:ParB-like chromosome segregation protein Spo0J